jgi:hypothetical protein
VPAMISVSPRIRPLIVGSIHSGIWLLLLYARLTEELEEASNGSKDDQG